MSPERFVKGESERTFNHLRLRLRPYDRICVAVCAVTTP